MKHLYQSLLLLMALLLPATATAYDFYVDGIYYLKNGSKATVTYKGTNSWSHNTYSGTVNIPTTVTYDGMTYSVTTIGNSAFYDCSGLTSVTIPNSVTSIGDHAFSNDRGLTSVTIPNSVTTIGYGAFCDCSGLTSVTIPNSVTSIGGYAFSNCRGLTSVTIPSSVITIGNDAFSGTTWYNNQPDGIVYAGLVAYRYKGTMPNNTSITIEDGTLGIAGGAFSGCSGLTSVTIPNSVTTIGNSAFSGCRGLTSVTIPSSVTTIGGGAFYGTAWFDNQPDGLVYAGLIAYRYKGTMPNNTSITIEDGTLGIAGGAFSGCSGLTSVTIPNSVTTIGNSAFSACSGLTGVMIPNSVTAIGEDAFYECSGLMSIIVASGNTSYDSRNNCNSIIETASNTLIAGCQNTVIPNTVTSIGNGAFSGRVSLTSVTIPNSVTSIGEFAFGDCLTLRSIEIPNSITTIGDYAFEGSGLTSVEIPNSVTFISEGAFADCFYLRHATIRCSAISREMFARCYGLSSVEISNTVTTIGESAFENCRNLTSVIISNSVTSIGVEAFNNCTALASVTIGNSLTSISDFLFDGCSALKSINIPNSVTTIGYGAFWSCSSLTSLAIPNSVTTINGYAFWGCSGLTNVTIPNSVTSISDELFHHCSGLTSVVIPNSVTTIGDQAFSGCISLTDVTIPNSVTTIGDQAFSGCISLTSVTIPNSVSAIGDEMFFSCSGLTSVTIPNSVTTIGVGAFFGCSCLTSVTIPNSVTTIGESAFGDCSGLTDVYSYIPDLSKVSCGIGLFSVNIDGGYDYSDRTLHVLPGMLNAYQTDERWYPCFGQIVEMTDLASSIELDKTTAVVIEGESLQLTATVLPEYAFVKTLAWSSSNAAVATVDDSGLVTAHSVGTATITAMTTDGSNLSASCVVTVKSLSATECLSMPDGEVLHGETITIPVRMTNAATVLAFQTDIFLPEGFTIDTNEDNEPIVTPSSRLTDDHIIMTQVANNGAVRVVCYTPTMQPISGNEGDLFYITVNVPADAAGDYAVYLRNTRLTIDDFTEVRIPDAGAVIDVKTYIPGDVNDTHSVNVADIVTTVRYVLDMDPIPFIFDAADMNGDGEVTVTDIMLIARQILYPTMNAPRQAPALSANGDRMSGEGITLSAGETRTVSINLDNARDYSAFQLDLRLPEGLTATNFRLTERAASHTLEVNTLRNGSIRALCYTPAIEAIDGNSGAVLTFDVTAQSAVTGDITVDGIELVTTACQGVRLDPFTIGVQTATAVTELSSGKTVAKVEYFNLAGQRLTHPATGVTLIVTTYTDGTRTTTKRLD